MKKYKILLLLSAVSFAGCQEEMEQNVGENGNAIPMSFYAGIEIPKDSISTRTVLGGASSDSYRNVLWKYQDDVYVTNGASSSKFVNTTEGSSDVALLEGELPPAADYYAAYPFDMVKGYSASGFKMELPSVQTYYSDGVSSGSFPMVAKCDDGIFSFRNLCGIFVLRLTGDETISSVTFSGKDASGKDISVAGNGTVSMDYSGNPSLIMEDAAVTSVTLKSSDGVRLNPSQPTAFHIVLPVGTYTTFNVIIKATDGTVMTVESKKALDIKRSNRTSAAALTYSGVIHYQDLNESGGTANSYIISSPGCYKFKAVKGNSSESVGEVSSVEVLWESFGTDVTPEVGDLVREVSHSDGCIQFSTPEFREGNAVIAAKNSSGTILWSWHIWLTDQPEEQVYYNNAGTMMDRNLGATSATPDDVGALGLLYQWGRKDPFIGASSISNNMEAKSTGTWAFEGESANTCAINYSIKNPMTFILGATAWYYNSYTDFHNRWQYEKTIYDPCPMGWQVPEGGPNGIWAKSLGTSDTMELILDINSIGINFTALFGDDTIIWYPLAGSRDTKGGQLCSVGEFGYAWSSTMIGLQAHTFNFFNSGKIAPYSNSYLFSGKPVRCVRE